MRAFVFTALLVMTLFAVACELEDDRSGSSSSRPAASSQSTIESYDPCKIAEQFIENRLRAPGTAKFRSGCFDSRKDFGVIRKTGLTYTVRVVVDSENGFGALLRSEFLVTVTHKGGITWGLDNLVQTR